jgi:hypothetical protein
MADLVLTTQRRRSSQTKRRLHYSVFTIISSLAFLHTTTAQILDFSPSGLPQCVNQCQPILTANANCIPPKAPQGPLSNYFGCFCSSQEVKPLYAGPSGVCDAACASTPGATAQLEQWFARTCHGPGGATISPAGSVAGAAGAVGVAGDVSGAGGVAGGAAVPGANGATTVNIAKPPNTGNSGGPEQFKAPNNGPEVQAPQGPVAGQPPAKPDDNKAKGKDVGAALGSTLGSGNLKGNRS